MINELDIIHPFIILMSVSVANFNGVLVSSARMTNVYRGHIKPLVLLMSQIPGVSKPFSSNVSKIVS
jgi:hypothetical protein